MEYDETSARELLEELDGDKSGLIDFQEFCAFIARIKAGDSKLKGFAVLTETLNTTSIGVLEEQCLKRHLKVSYDIVEERPATAMCPDKHVVMEVRLEGEWMEPSSDGGITRTIGLRRFQGIGKSTREGRMNAAETALKKLRDMMPGLDVEQGVIPRAWERWLKDNARKGVELNRLLAQLRAKGFAPFANPEVMQWALATGGLDRLIEAHPNGGPTVEGGADLRPEWRAWIDHCLSTGLDGAVLLEVLRDRGISTRRMEGHAQRLRRGEGSTGADLVRPRLLDFWQCCESGLLFEVELYLSAGQPPDAGALHLPRGAVSLPLALAAARGHCEVVDALISRKAEVDAKDLMGRTALHHAAKHGNVEACRRADCCELLAFHGEETVRNVVSDRIPVADKPFTKIMEAAFPRMLKDRLRSNETHRFRKDWIYDAALWCRDQMHPSKRAMLLEPSQELVDYVVGRFDPDPDAGFWHLNAGHPPTFIPSVVEPWHLSTMLRHIFRLSVCSSKDSRGWSALHQACVENHVCSHEETIRVLVQHHQLNLFQSDMNGKLAVELLFNFSGGRLNTPSGSREKEGLLMDQRRDILVEARKNKDVEEEEEKERGRVETLLKIRQKSVDMEPELWLAAQEASVHLRTLGGWMEYLDPDTMNRFFYQNELVLRVSEDDSKGKEESVDHFQWEKPEEFAKFEAVLLGWASIINSSEFLRTTAGSRYNSVLDRASGVVFYVDTSDETCLLMPPREAETIASFLVVCLELAHGFVTSVAPAAGMTCGHRGASGGSCGFRDRPVEAVPPVDLTAGDHPICTMDGDMEMFRVCVACARNCHKGRLGHRTRFCKLSNTRCMCCERGEGSCLYFSKKICRRKADTPVVEGWMALHDPELPDRIHGRSAGTEEFTLPDEHDLPKPEPLEWEFQKDRLHMMGTTLFFFHEDRRECTWDPPPEATLTNPSWSTFSTTLGGDDDPVTLDTPPSQAAAAALTAPIDGMIAADEDTTTEVAPREGVSLGDGDKAPHDSASSARKDGNTAAAVPSAAITGAVGSTVVGESAIVEARAGSDVFPPGEGSAEVQV
ncbi:unnamed protein product [Ectocarpus sp. 6 AP-2014]